MSSVENIISFRVNVFAITSVSTIVDKHVFDGKASFHALVPARGDNGPRADAPVATLGLAFFQIFGSGAGSGAMDHFSLAEIPEPPRSR